MQLIAGGSGIVPLMSIVRAHHGAAHPEPMRLLYSVRTPADALYADELTGLVDSTFTLDWVHTREAPSGSVRRAGRIDAATIAELALPPDVEPLVYVCGPTGFVESVASILVAARPPGGPDPYRALRRSVIMTPAHPPTVGSPIPAWTATRPVAR